MVSIEQVARRLEIWSQLTFGNDLVHGPEGPSRHLQREAAELAQAPYDGIECADCLLVVLDINRRAGRTLQQLFSIALEKLAVNESREWEPMDKDGVSEHRRTSA